MHEMSITRSLLEIIRGEMERSSIGRLKAVRLRVGELTAVEPDALRFCFETATKGTPMEGARLEIEEVPLTGKCLECAESFRIEGFVSACPRCASTRIERTGGDELDIISMEY